MLKRKEVDMFEVFGRQGRGQRSAQTGGNCAQAGVKIILLPTQ